MKAAAFCYSIGLAVGLLATGGCGDASKNAAPEVAPIGIPADPTEAQPRLQTAKLWLGPAEINAELALTFDQLRTGLMFRKQMAETDGMLFVFGAPQTASFYMKNTVIPLSIAYIDPDGVILEIHDLEPLNTNTVRSVSDRVQFALETNRDWFKRHHVEVGATVRTEQGSLQTTFFGRKN